MGLLDKMKGAMDQAQQYQGQQGAMSVWTAGGVAASGRTAFCPSALRAWH